MEYLIAIFLFFLGAISASFMAVVSERLYTGQSWIHGRSRCNSCSEALAARDLVPIVSWALSAGRCRMCGSRVPVAYAIGEGLLGALFVFAYLSVGLTFSLVSFLLALTTLAFIVMYDLRHTIVPPVASSLLIVFAFVYALLVSPSWMYFGLTTMVAGIIGFGFFLLYALSKGRVMGLGDSPVALALALLVGPTLAIPGLLFSFWIGAAVGIAILVTRPKGHRMGIEVPFVPFLAAGYLLAFFTKWNPLLLTL